ncbi:hypothetical protein [Peribacillus sp. SCS-155]|uniref:hypothetical protein n=1 Tax=Peribacillus sedimenti TaxID=3115297 RepID=UPI003906BC73
MDGMKVRFELQNLYLKVSNVTRNDESYVLLRAYDDSNNDLVLELTHEQAGFLEDQFYEANRRYEQRVFGPVVQKNVPPSSNLFPYVIQYPSNPQQAYNDNNPGTLNRYT